LVVALARELRNIDDRTTAVVLRGSGRSFCSGHDLRDQEELNSRGTRTEADIHAAVERMQDITRAFRECRIPVIGAIHGYAVGGGCELALSCDLIVATRTAVFGFPETGVALLVTNGVNATLARSVGPALAKELILLGEFFTAEKALQLQLINRVVEEDELDAAVSELIARLRTRGPLAVRLSKRLIDQGLADDMDHLLERESAAVIAAEQSADALAGVAAFTTRGQPAYAGE